MKKIVIIGGGASGLACALTLNELKKLYQMDLSITILEANEKLGKKILASGNGRCNLSNTNISANYYHHKDDFVLETILNDFSVYDFFDHNGLWTRVEGELYYPNSKQASSVVRFFEKHLDDVMIAYHTKAEHIDVQNRRVITSQGIYLYDELILACGSKAAAKLGGNDSGYRMLKELNHHITDLKPALVQLKSKQVEKYLKGCRLRGTFSLIREGKCIAKEKGELLFSDYGLSGIAIFQLSRFYEYGDEIEIDLFDDLSENELNHRLKELLSNNALDLEMILPSQYGRFLSGKIHEINYSNTKEVVKLLKHYHFKIDGLNDFENAQIVRGGLRMSEVNDDLSSKLVDHLYICGELLDIDGPCGGYNLHFAFSSGYKVAANIIYKLMGGDQ